MWTRGRRITCFLAAAALALPTGAWAQSAGDDQYQDPFAPGSGQNEDGGGGGDGSGGGTDAPSAQPAPEPATPEPGTPEPSTPESATPGTAAPETTAPAAPAATAQELPRTGVDERLVALAGAGLLISGLALRRRSRSSAGRA